VSRPHGAGLDAQIGAAVREARLNRGVTQGELAAALGLTHGSIARYETGTRSLSVAQLLRIGQVLGVPAPSLLPGGGGAATALPTASPHGQAIETLVRVLEKHPDLMPAVLAALEQGLAQRSS
jgi:transcriptional regulator with XRE-family HTH domain